MKRTNRVLILAIIFTLMMTCTACGNDVSGQITPAESQTESSETSRIEPVESVTPTEGPVGSITPIEEPSTEASATDETAVEEADLEEKPVSLGRMQGGTYVNEYIGLACDLDSTWEFYTAEELQELPTTAAELFEDTELGEYLDSTTRIMDMQAECPNDLTTMNVLYQKMDMQQRLAYAMATEEEIIDSTLAESDLLVDSYNQMGLEVVDMTKKQVTFLGEERYAIHTVAKIGEVDFYALQLCDYHLGQYAITITLSSYMEDKTEDVLNLFYKYE